MMNRSLWLQRYNRARLAALCLQLVPYVRLVGLNGSMATGYMHEGSDIDFYIVTAPGKIFLTKELATLAMTLMGVKRRGSHVAGRICLNRFATNDFLEITPHDEYHARVFHNLIPLAGDVEVWKAYRKANSWMKEFGYTLTEHELRQSWIMRWIQMVFEILLFPVAWLGERLAEKWQKARTSQNDHAQLADSVVVLSHRELRFHLHKD